MISRHRFHRAGGPRPLILGHRGARAFEPENTLRAFRRALLDGADGVELDVRLSSDGQAFITHDDELRLWGLDEPKHLSRLTAAQVKGSRLLSGEPIPTLTEALLFQAETGCLMNVELKGDVPAPGCLAEVTAQKIAVHGGDGIVVSSFSPFIVWKIARLLPHVPVALLIDEGHTLARNWAPLRLLGATGMNPHRSLLDGAFIRKHHRRGTFICAWTVNDPADGRQLAEDGVDVLIGDDPGALLRALGSPDPR